MTVDALPILRAERPVRAYLSALGRVRETRLTATFAFLLARFPTRLLHLLGLKHDDGLQVCIEETTGGDRFDVLVGHRSERVIIEGKADLSQDPDQLERYVEAVRAKYHVRPRLVLVDSGRDLGFELPSRLKRLIAGYGHVRWTTVEEECSRIAKSKACRKLDLVGAAIAQDFAEHLREAGMIDERPSEIYLREVSTPSSVELYFRHRIYKCQPGFVRSAQENLYFAPYFTAKACKLAADVTLVPIGAGISYISRIEDVAVFSKRELRAAMTARGCKDPAKVTKLITSEHKESRVLILFLGEPHQLFTTPVSKSQLHVVNPSFTAGTLGSRSCSLEDLLAASKVTKTTKGASRKKRPTKRRSR